MLALFFTVSKIKWVDNLRYKKGFLKLLNSGTLWLAAKNKQCSHSKPIPRPTRVPSIQKNSSLIRLKTLNCSIWIYNLLVYMYTRPFPHELSIGSSELSESVEFVSFPDRENVNFRPVSSSTSRVGDLWPWSRGKVAKRSRKFFGEVAYP